VNVYVAPLTKRLVKYQTLVLITCLRQQIGYHRQALEEIARQSSFKLASSLDRLRLAFVTHEFLSIENACKLPRPKPVVTRRTSSNSTSSASTEPVEASLKPGPAALPPQAIWNARAVPPPFPLTIPQMCEPLRRCPKCTLLPPCSHFSLAKMLERVERARSMYPNRATDAATSSTPVCLSFVRRGVCSNVQSIGRCRFAHPLDLHEIDKRGVAPRCVIHTLPLPCMHCGNVRALSTKAAEEAKALAGLEKQLQQARKLAADLETERFLFLREQGKAVKWGNAKRDLDDRRAELDARVRTAKVAASQLAADLNQRKLQLDKLRADVAHGRSKGEGKTRGGAVGGGEDDGGALVRSPAVAVG
jgi:hypothetical protein